MILLVTGGAGFIGSNFIRYILANRSDWQIINLDTLTYAGNLANFNELPTYEAQRHHFLKGDIGDKKLLQRLFSKGNFDAVIHFAAESHVDRSIALGIFQRRQPLLSIKPIFSLKGFFRSLCQGLFPHLRTADYRY